MRSLGSSTPSIQDGLAGVLWDMDGTLIDSEKLWDVALFEAAEWLGGRLLPEHRLRLVGSNMDNSTRYLLGVVGQPVTVGRVQETSQWIRKRITNLFDEELPWRPGAREALTAVHSAGIPSALVTSTDRSVTELALNTIGRDFFDVTVCGDEVGGLNKPYPQPYLLAADLLGVATSGCVAVEDSPLGVKSAVAAGCVVLVIPNTVPVKPGERRIFRSSLVGVDVPTLVELNTHRYLLPG